MNWDVSGIAENPKTKEERIQILEEKLKGMKDIELGSVSKISYMGPHMILEKLNIIEKNKMH